MPTSQQPEEQHGGLLQSAAPSLSAVLTAPKHSAEKAQNQLGSDLRECLQRWIADQCVAMGCGAANPRILHREFVRWSGLEGFSEYAFVVELESIGFPLDGNGMIYGLVLGIDFVAVLEYERDRCA